MKTIKQISKILLATVIFVTSASTLFSQERKESFEKTYEIKSDGEFSFSCYDTDLKVNTWQKDEVKLFGEIKIEGGNKENQDKLIEIFKDPEVSQSFNSLHIETNIIKGTIGIPPIMKITLVNGKVINIKKFKVNYTLWIPETINFNLKSKYNNIDIANLTGKVRFDLYDVDLTMLGYGKDSKFEMKYSSASIGKGGDAIMDIYDCEIEAIEMNNVEINSKYSEIDISSINTLDFNSYDDEIEIGKINSLTSKAKYTDYRIKGNMANCIINFYDSDINAQNIDQLVFSGKYSSINALDVKSVKINDLYDSNIELGKVGEFSCNESKYDEIEFEVITKSISFTSAYSLDLNVAKVEPSFESFTGNFKYGSVSMNLDPKLEFSLDFDITYGDVDFPKDRIKVKDFNIKESSKHSFEGSTSENPKCKIKFSGHDTDFDLE